MEKFASYGFNKAHSASYGLIAYWTAYLKANFPAQYMTALLTSELQGVAGPMREIKMAQALEECRRMKIEVFIPDINSSLKRFHIERSGIRFGLSAIKNVGEAAIDAILEARQKGGFLGFVDFLQRIDLRRVNKKTVESLIKANAFSNFGNRATLLFYYPTLVKEITDKKIDDEKGQFSLFAPSKTDDEVLDNFKVLNELSETDLMAMEKEVIGFLITKNPLSMHQVIIKKKITRKIGEITADDINTDQIIAGIVSGKKVIKTKKNNQEMAFLTLFDETGSIELIVFPKLYEKLKDILAIGRILLMKGKINDKDGKLSVILDNAVDLDKVKY